MKVSENWPIRRTILPHPDVDMVTVTGAGHMVPYDKPLSALQMITNFLRATDYSRSAGVNTQPSCSESG